MSWVDDFEAEWDLMTHYDPVTMTQIDRVEELIELVRKLGGPVCIDCQENQARYTTDRCALCDMKLPEDQRGVRHCDVE